MGRSNFTPMKRFHEILDNYGLKLMEVGTNHLRVFFGNRKLFDYYPLRMKLFDYQAVAATDLSVGHGRYGQMGNGTGRNHQQPYGITAINIDIMHKKNRQTLVWDNIPEWAIFALEYGIEEELFLPNEDLEMIKYGSSARISRTAAR